ILVERFDGVAGQAIGYLESIDLVVSETIDAVAFRSDPHGLVAIHEQDAHGHLGAVESGYGNRFERTLLQPLQSQAWAASNHAYPHGAVRRDRQRGNAAEVFGRLQLRRQIYA